MDVWRSPSNRTAVVSPAGELDLATSGELRTALLQACEGSRLVLVDLVAVTFLDSTALGVLVGAQKRCQSNGAQLLVINATGICLKVLRVTGLGGLISDEPLPADLAMLQDD